MEISIYLIYKNNIIIMTLMNGLQHYLRASILSIFMKLIQ